MQFFSSLVICIIISTFQYVSNNKLSHDILDWPIIQTNNYLDRNDDFKYQFGYSVLGKDQEWTDYSIEYIKNVNNYTENDIKMIFKGDNEIISDFETVNEYLKNNPDQIQIATIFCTSDKQILGKPYSCQQNPIDFPNKNLKSYILVIDGSEIQNSPTQDVNTGLKKSTNALKLKLIIDNSLASFYQWKKINNRPFVKNTDQVLNLQSIFIETQDYPTPPFRVFDGQDVVASTGAFYFLIPIMFSFLSMTQDIMKEKDGQIRQYLNVIGVSHFDYWVSWLITTVFYNILTSGSICIFAYSFQFQFFLDTPFIIIFFLFFSLGFAFNIVSFFLVSICSSLKVSNTVSYSFMLVTFVIQLLLSNIFLVYNLYGDDVPSWVVVVQYILTLYPPFNFAKAFGDISQFSGNHFDIVQTKWIKGPGYSYSQFTKQINIQMRGVHIVAPSTFQSLSYMYLDALFFGILCWYFDNVITREQKCLFFLNKNYWFPKVENESLALIQQNQDSNIVVQNVSKQYRKSFWDKNGHQALKDLSFQVETGELLTILGHNGVNIFDNFNILQAGKSTLISIMTGNIKPSFGKVYLGKLEIQENKDVIRKLIGICPQFDIQFPELTARQHIEIFSELKGIQNQYIEKLTQVDLQEVAEAKVRTFSGGMKRRLSIAIAGLGDPKIIFLDEPTTGMDPKSRRKVWHLIQNLKKNRSIILTTHAMEEADVLSERIMVVNKGELKCIGTALNLKNTYGDGYKLSLIVEIQHTQEVIKFIKQLLPTSKLLDSSGGSLMFTIPLSQISDLQQFFNFLETKQDLGQNQIKSKIQDWSLSNTTLEEVFMKMTGHSDHLLD